MRNPIFAIMESQQNQINNQVNDNQPGFNANTMKEMIHLFQNNPQLLKNFNDLVIQKNENYMNNPLLNEEYLQHAVKGEVPRNVFNQFKDDNKTYNANSNDEYSEKLNITFQLTSGKKINIIASQNMKLKTLFREFVKKIGFDTNILQNDIYFLYRGERMNKDEQSNLKKMGLENNSVILVMDVKGIIGAN